MRGNLPPEAQVPAINIESADSQFAAAYLSFASDDPRSRTRSPTTWCASCSRASRRSQGVQRADILGGRTFAMRVWLKPDRMAALNVSPSQVRAALAANNYLTALGQHQGQPDPGQPHGEHGPALGRGVQELVIRQQNGAIVRLRDVADVVLGAEDYDTDVRFSGETAVFMGV